MADTPTPEPAKAVTIYDVAERAGVSASTVSRVFSRPDRVSFETAERIRAVAVELGYRTRLATRVTDPADARLRTHTLGLVIADATNPFFQEVRRGADHVAATEDLVVLTADIRESRQAAKLAVSRMTPLIDGILLASSRMSNGDVQKVARQLPTVVINRPVPGVPSVVIDNYTGTMRAALHLYEQGARSVTYLSGPQDSWADGVRWRALLDAVGNADPTELPSQLTRPGTSTVLNFEQAQRLKSMRISHAPVDEPSIRGGQRAFVGWQQNPSDAVLCFNDLVAIGFLSQARREGVAVPEDVLVVGYDNTPLASLVQPGLTTVAGPLRSLGRVAAANAIALAKGLKTQIAKPRVLPTRLIVRGSSLRTGGSGLPGLPGS